MNSKIRSLKPALAALVVGLALWVLLPAPSVQANTGDTGSSMGQLRVGMGTPPGGGGKGGGTNDDGGGLNADPDTFEIDSYLGAPIGSVENPVQPVVPGGPFGRFLGWLLAFWGGRMFLGILNR